MDAIVTSRAKRNIQIVQVFAQLADSYSNYLRLFCSNSSIFC